MKKLTPKEQKLQEALDIIGMKRYSFSTRTYHILQGRISVGRTHRFEFTGAYDGSPLANQLFRNPITGKNECIDSFLLKSTGIKTVKTLFNAIVKLEIKTEKEYLDSYTRKFTMVC